MKKKTKVSLSQILLCISILTLLGAGFIAAVVSEHAPVFAAFKEKGVAAEGTVTGKDIRVSQETSRKGRKRETKRHFLTFSYNGMSTTPHAEAAAGKPMRPAPHATTVHGDIQVSTGEYESHAIGAKTLVTYLPDSPFQPKLTASVEDYTPVWQITTAVVLALAGLATAFLSWKKRRPKIPVMPMSVMG
jgi:hypothetical protein